MTEHILMLTGTGSPRGQGMKRSILGARSSLKVTQAKGRFILLVKLTQGHASQR